MGKLIIKDIKNEEYSIDYIIKPSSQLLLESHYDDFSATGLNTDKAKQSLDKNPDVFEAEYEETTESSHKFDYKIAAASGLLCSMLDIFYVGKFSLNEANLSGSEDADKLVIKVAKLLGNKGEGLGSAISFLQKYNMAGDVAKNYFGGSLQHHLRDFSHHPTIIGLIFSIITQFTYTVYGTNTNGDFDKFKLNSDCPYIGRDQSEKILFGTVFWLFHLLSDMSGSTNSIGKGTGIPGPILGLLKNASVLPIIKDIKIKYKDQGDIKLSVWISKLFNGTYFWNKETGQKIRFDLRTEMGITNTLFKQSLPVIINECIVRGFYFVNRLIAELENKHIDTISKLTLISPDNILPYNNRVLTRMLTIATGVFSTIDIAQAACAAALKKATSNDPIKPITEFFIRINFPGIGRFAIALIADAKYISKDIVNLYRKYQQKVYTIHRELYTVPDIKEFSLTDLQTRIMFSLEYRMLMRDIDKTKNENKKEIKQRWADIWMDSVQKAYQQNKAYLIKNNDELIMLLQNEIKSDDNKAWLYSMLLDIDNFTAYSKLSEEKDNPYKGLKLSKSYIKDELCRTYHIIPENDYDKLKKTYQNYTGVLCNNTGKIAIGVATTTVLIAATGGTAVFFAPGIATAIMGGSFVGIYGAALSSASLAALGGGAIAAGGLGMAGGTALIASGGAVIGLVGGGVITASSAILGSSKEQTLTMLSKLLTISKLVIADKYEGKNTLIALNKNIELMIARMEHDIEVMKDSLTNSNPDIKKKTNKEIKICKESLDYLKRCSNELVKLQKSIK